MSEHIAWAAVGVWALKELYAVFKDDKRKNTDALMQNTLAVVELRVELRYLKALLDEVPKLRKDVDAAHARLRDLGK